MKLPTWGGRRAGAGRKPKGKRAGVPHIHRSLPRRSPAHVTMRVVTDLPSLRNGRLFRAVRRSFIGGKDRFGFRLIHFSVQGDHLHLLVEAENAVALSRGMKGLAVRIARAVNRVAERRGQVFPDRFHSRALASPREVANALRYILRNHEHHGLGHGVDRCSSADPRAAEDATVGARTWLVCIVLEGGRGRTGPPQRPGRDVDASASKSWP